MIINNIKIENYLVAESSNIRDAGKKLDNGGIGFIAIVDKKKRVLGVLTDGDFRRSVLKGVNLDKNVKSICNTNFEYVTEDEQEKIIINKFLSTRVNIIPQLSSDKKLIKILQREGYDLKGKVVLPEKRLAIPVVIMAGGKGTRMKPFTNILPKPLLPVGNRSMLEVIMDEYIKFGLDNFYLTINYKGGLIKAYLEDADNDYKISYIEEDRFLGTAGALKLLPVKKPTPIFVSNCDILIKDNYMNILEFHNSGKYDLTLVAAMTHHQVPYGVCKIKNGGELDELSEKPEYDYLVNSGMYILNSHVLGLIPENEFFHITQLMEKIKSNGGKVGVYPVSEKTWIDVGQWSEYRKSLDLLKI